MQLITGDTQGYVYIVCLDAPIGNLSNPRAQARHYLGWALDYRARIATHAAGHGSPVIRTAVERGIGFTVYAFHGTPHDERHLKRSYKNTPCLCPQCSQLAGRAGRMPLLPAAQLRLPYLETMPDVLPSRRTMDWYEASTLKRWRATTARVLPALTDDWDTGLL